MRSSKLIADACSVSVPLDEGVDIETSGTAWTFSWITSDCSKTEALDEGVDRGIGLEGSEPLELLLAVLSDLLRLFWPLGGVPGTSGRCGLA